VVGSSTVLGSLLDAKSNTQLDPRQYLFRMFITLKTADERYAEEVNFTMWVGSGMFKGSELVLE
jgi:hypothetical protein